MSIEEILAILDQKEIDYRLESNFCCGYFFYFLDGSVYPRRWMDTALEGTPVQVIAETPDSLLNKAMAYELSKDWRYRIEGDDLSDTFKQVEAYLNEHYIL